MSTQKEGEPPKQGGSNTALIVIIVLLVVVILAGLAGFGCWYMYDKAKDTIASISPSPTASESTKSNINPIPVATTDSDFELPPSDVAKDFLWYTVGTITGSSLDNEAAKDLVSYELAQKMDNSAFIPQALCIQQGPDEIKIASEDIYDNMEAIVKVKASWGGEWQTPWEFELINGEDGWKIKTITCLDTGQITQ